MSSKAPVQEGGPAGSGVFGTTISAAPERPGGAVLGEIKKELFPDISQKSGSVYLRRPFCRSAPQSPLPAAGGPGS